ncbi:MAG: glycosyltransferase [Treponema sp.]|nr:glycosyltransferase [Treponema sp.]
MKLSIITINKNNAAGLEKTIQSVINQTYTDFEYIVIDGNSTDGSVEVLKKFTAKIHYWVSEPDTGIYNAMNKGIRKALGEFCLFLNSGDWIISPSILNDAFNEISTCISADIYYCDKTQTDGVVFKYPEFLTINYLISTPISHQNSLIKHSLFNEHGFYNEDLSIGSDWEFFLKELWKYRSKFTHIKTNISAFDINGIGSQSTYERYAEMMTMHQNVFESLAETIIEINNYHNTTYRNIVENYGTSKLLVFFLKSYKFIISKTYKIKSSISGIMQYTLKKFSSISNILFFLYEMFISIFDKSIRICFTNFQDVPHDFFLIPLSDQFGLYHIPYKIVNSYKPQIQFFSVFGKKNKILKSKALCKIFYAGKNVNYEINRKNYNTNCIDDVSLSFGFDYINTDNYFRLPLWLLYYFKPNDTKDDIGRKLNNFKKKNPKNKFCSLIASHDRNGIKTKIYNEVIKIDHVDCPGILLHNDETLHKRYSNDKVVYLQQYKFNICPENSISPGYVTEKLFQALYSGCIPIYSGWNNDPETDIINPNIIIFYDSTDDTKNISSISEVKKIHSVDKLYNSFIAQPFFCDTAIDKVSEMLQQFTNKIQCCINTSFIDSKLKQDTRH